MNPKCKWVQRMYRTESKSKTKREERQKHWFIVIRADFSVLRQHDSNEIGAEQRAGRHTDRVIVSLTSLSAAAEEINLWIFISSYDVVVVETFRRFEVRSTSWDCPAFDWVFSPVTANAEQVKNEFRALRRFPYRFERAVCDIDFNLHKTTQLQHISEESSSLLLCFSAHRQLQLEVNSFSSFSLQLNDRRSFY